MTTLAPLESVLGETPSLVLPIRGREFVVTECSGAAWLRYQAALKQLEEQGEDLTAGQLMDVARTHDVTDRQVYVDALGDAWQQMVDAGLSRRELMFCGQTAWLWQLGLHGAAAVFWGSGGKAFAPTTAPTTPTTTSSTAGASGSRSSGPGSTTTSPSTSKPNGPAARPHAKGRRGPRSSPTAT